MQMVERRRGAVLVMIACVILMMGALSYSEQARWGGAVSKTPSMDLGADRTAMIEVNYPGDRRLNISHGRTFTQSMKGDFPQVSGAFLAEASRSVDQRRSRFWAKAILVTFLGGVSCFFLLWWRLQVTQADRSNAKLVQLRGQSVTGAKGHQRVKLVKRSH